MAFYALKLSDIISADEAREGIEYHCVECQSAMRVRLGKRRKHFYHVKKSFHCRLYSKSEKHLLIQLHLQSLFGKKEAILEKPFLPIRRIADVCWEKYKLIFEVQCSPIAQKEAEKRIADYQSLGYIVVWLLEETIFNQRHAGASERFLRSQLGYYVCFSKDKTCLFYDQFELIQEGRFLQKSPPLPIKLFQPQNMPAELPSNVAIPTQVYKRHQTWPLFFLGDIVHQTLLAQLHKPTLIALQNWAQRQASAKEKASIKKNPSWLFPLYRLIEWLVQKIDGR